jgi:hypothetical protein
MYDDVVEGLVLKLIFLLALLVFEEFVDPIELATDEVMESDRVLLDVLDDLLTTFSRVLLSKVFPLLFFVDDDEEEEEAAAAEPFVLFVFTDMMLSLFLFVFSAGDLTLAVNISSRFAQ